MQLSSYNPLSTISKLNQLRNQLNSDAGEFQLPAGDAGLVGPGPAWKVLADDCILIGGAAALMLQALHPLVMAGVAEHSNYMQDPLKRLVDTGIFVRGTLYGPADEAETRIAVVRRVHEYVKGVAPDGRNYSATDPELLAWVHVCEAYGFVRAHQRYHPQPIRGIEIDDYYRQLAVVGEKLGAQDLPRSRAEVTAYFDQMRPQLVSAAQSQETMRFILRPALNDAFMDRFFRLVALGGVGLLPEWARQLHGLQRGLATKLATPQLQVIFHGARVVFGRSPVARSARQRLQAA